MKVIWMLAGIIALILAVIGAILPVMPTVPFILLAAYCFAQGSPRMHQYLLNHHQFGPHIRAWQKHRAIPRRAKIWATAMLSISLPVTTYLLGEKYFLISLSVIILCIMIMTWIWRCPDA